MSFYKPAGSHLRTASSSPRVAAAGSGEKRLPATTAFQVLPGEFADNGARIQAFLFQ